MAKTVDFNKMRKRRQRTQTIKRLLALLFVMGGIAGIFALNNFLIEQEIPTRISDVVESLGGSGYPIEVPGGIIRSVRNVGNNLAVLNDTNLFIYNEKGKLISNIQQMSETSVIRTSASRILAFDAGKKRFGIFSKSRPIHEQTMPYSIINAAMNNRGDYAIVTSSNQFVAETRVYNRQHTEIFYWSSADNLVLDVALSPKGDRMAVGCLNAQDGVLKTIILIFRLDSDKEEDVQRFEILDEMVLRVEFPEKDRVTVLTDARFAVLDEQAKEKGSYLFGEKQVLASETYKDHTLLLLESREKPSHLVLLERNAKEHASLTLDYAAQDIAIGRDKVYLLHENGMNTYTYKMQPEYIYNQFGIQAMHVVDNTLYYLNEEEIRVWNQSEVEKEKEKQSTPQSLQSEKTASESLQ